MSKTKIQVELGTTYGEWITVSNQGRQVLCQCSCGTQKLVCKYALFKGRSTNCGCKHKLKPIPIGTVFGNLKVLSNIEKRGERGELLILVECKCSQQKYVNQNSLKKGLTKSCGCLRNEKIRKHKTIHGLCNSYEYKAWLYIKSICYNKNHSQYKYYGGCGIEVNLDWRNNFIQFLKDVGLAPSGASISRLDSSKNFSAANCSWEVKIDRKRRVSQKNSEKPDSLVTKRKTKIFLNSVRSISEINTAIIIEHAEGEPNINKLALKYQLSKMEIVDIIL